MSLNSTVLYRATLGTWSTHQLNQLDSELQSLYKKIFRMMPGYAGELIQLPTEWGGLGCQSLRKKLVGTKWAVVHRNETKRAVSSALLMRGDLLNGIMRYPGQATRIRPGDGLWATSLLTDAEEVGLILKRGGNDMAGTMSQQISDSPEYDQHAPAEKVILSRLSLSTLGDLTTISREKRSWNKELRGFSTVIDNTMTETCPQGNIKLQPLQ